MTVNLINKLNQGKSSEKIWPVCDYGLCIVEGLLKQTEHWCQKSKLDGLRRNSLHTLGWWLQTSTLMGVITVMSQKRWETPEVQIKPKTVLIWWISPAVFKNSSRCLSAVWRMPLTLWFLDQWAKSEDGLNQDSKFARGHSSWMFDS